MTSQTSAIFGTTDNEGILSKIATMSLDRSKFNLDAHNRLIRYDQGNNKIYYQTLDNARTGFEDITDPNVDGSSLVDGEKRQIPYVYVKMGTDRNLRYFDHNDKEILTIETDVDIDGGYPELINKGQQIISGAMDMIDTNLEKEHRKRSLKQYEQHRLDKTIVDQEVRTKEHNVNIGTLIGTVGGILFLLIVVILNKLGMIGNLSYHILFIVTIIALIVFISYRLSILQGVTDSIYSKFPVPSIDEDVPRCTNTENSDQSELSVKQVALPGINIPITNMTPSTYHIKDTNIEESGEELTEPITENYISLNMTDMMILCSSIAGQLQTSDERMNEANNIDTNEQTIKILSRYFDSKDDMGNQRMSNILNTLKVNISRYVQNSDRETSSRLNYLISENKKEQVTMDTTERAKKEKKLSEMIERLDKTNKKVNELKRSMNNNETSLSEGHMKERYHNNRKILELLKKDPIVFHYSTPVRITGLAVDIISDRRKTEVEIIGVKGVQKGSTDQYFNVNRGRLTEHLVARGTVTEATVLKCNGNVGLYDSYFVVLKDYGMRALISNMVPLVEGISAVKPHPIYIAGKDNTCTGRMSIVSNKSSSLVYAKPTPEKVPSQTEYDEIEAFNNAEEIEAFNVEEMEGTFADYLSPLSDDIDTTSANYAQYTGFLY